MTSWIGDSTTPTVAPDISSSPGLKKPHRACLNCRRKKVRCHGEQPACSFCVRLGQSCRYPGQASTSRSNTNLDDSSTSKLYPALLSRIATIEAELNAVRLANNSPSVDAKPNGAWTEDVSAPDEWPSSGTWQPSSTSDPISNKRPQPPTLPPLEIQLLAIDDFFSRYHGQPYCFFHEESFRLQFSRGLLPDYLVLAVLCIALRYSKDNYDSTGTIAADLAAKGWSLVLGLAFDGAQAPTYRLVQAATLLALFDFTACQHGTAWIKIGVAVSLSQALHMTEEPSVKLSPASREERRRTLWSVYCLDKLATCGRRRPALFLDKNCNLHLPNSDYAFQTSTEEVVPTLNQLKSSEDFTIYMIDSPATTIVAASVLSQITVYLLHQSDELSQKPPWDHNSEYSPILSQLARLETVFDICHPVHKQLEASDSFDAGLSFRLTEASIFSYVIYQLCHCLLHHPILLRCRFNGANSRVPPSFFPRALESCRLHAAELSNTMIRAKKAGYVLGASFYGYSLLVSGTIHAMFKNSEDEEIRTQSSEMLQSNVNMLKEKAKVFQNSARMAVALMHFASESHSYRSLIDTKCTSIYLSPTEVERLYSLLDYGSMSTTPAQNTDAADLEEITDATSEPFDNFSHLALTSQQSTSFYPPSDQFPIFVDEDFNYL